MKKIPGGRDHGKHSGADHENGGIFKKQNIDTKRKAAE